MSRPAHAILLDDEFVRDPYPTLRRFRDAEFFPRVRLRYGVSALLVSRYADARQVLESPAVRKDFRPALRMVGTSRPDAARMSAHMLNADPPEHARLRRLAAPAVSYGRPQGWAPVIAGLVRDLLDRMGRNGAADLITEFALPLPVALVCRILGVPPEDRDQVLRWSSDLVLQADAESVALSTARLGGYLDDLLECKRRRPEDDGLSLLAAHGPGASGRLSHAELVSNAFLLLFAGHETTVNAIGNGLLALLEHPDQLARLRDQPDLPPAAVEEILRYDSPVSHATIRYTSADLDIGGRLLPKGRLVLVSLAAANRDGDVFTDPDTLDVDRAPSRHLAFGHGPHFCLGAQLARFQVQLAIGELVRRFPRLRLAVDPGRLRWRPSTFMRGLEALPVRLD